MMIVDPMRLALSVPEAITASGIGRTLLYEAIGKGDLATIKIGARRLIMIDDLREWLRRHREATSTPLAAAPAPRPAQPAEPTPATVAPRPRGRSRKLPAAESTT